MQGTHLYNSPINYADLSCVEALWIRDDEGHEYAQVEIEEAGSLGLQDYVRKQLDSAGWPDVMVRTSW